MEPRNPLGQLAYETYMDTIRAVDPMTFYLAWDNLHSDTQHAYQRAAEAVWVAAFQAGADSVVLRSFEVME